MNSFIPTPKESLNQEDPAPTSIQISKSSSLKKTIFILSATLMFIIGSSIYFLWRSIDYKNLIAALEPQVKLLEAYQTTFKNKPFNIINKHEDSYTIEYFSAAVLNEVNDSFHIKIYEEWPNETLRPGGSYLWDDIKINENQVPGEAFLVTMLVSNAKEQQTFHSFRLTGDRATPFTPIFERKRPNKLVKL